MTENALPVIPADRADDMHHLEIAAEADLVLFMAGNQFMVMPEIISAFQTRNPEIKKIFYETLPPGLELKQILAGGALWQNKPFTVYPVDVGPVWVTEAVQARTSRLAFDVIEPGSQLDQRDSINYYICRLKNAAHPQNAQEFIDFILSPVARNIYENFGFVPHPPKRKN